MCAKGGLSQTQKIASELRKAVIGPGLVRSSTLNKISTSSQSSVGATATKTLPSSSSLDTSSLQLKANASSSADGVDVNWGEFNEAPETLQKAESSSSDCDDAWRRNTVRMNREASPSSATSETECSLLGRISWSSLVMCIPLVLDPTPSCHESCRSRWL